MNINRLVIDWIDNRALIHIPNILKAITEMTELARD